MDAGQSRAVTEAFVKMYEKGLIYRSDYLVNWSCALQSAISDIEVEYLEVDGPSNIAVTGYEKPVQFGVLTKFAYKLHESGIKYTYPNEVEYSHVLVLLWVPEILCEYKLMVYLAFPNFYDTH